MPPNKKRKRKRANSSARQCAVCASKRKGKHTTIQNSQLSDVLKLFVRDNTATTVCHRCYQAIAKAKANNEPAILKSTIPGSGLGLFLHKTVEAGEWITNYGGRVLSVDQAKSMPTGAYLRTLQRGFSILDGATGYRVGLQQQLERATTTDSTSQKRPQTRSQSLQSSTTKPTYQYGLARFTNTLLRQNESQPRRKRRLSDGDNTRNDDDMTSRADSDCNSNSSRQGHSCTAKTKRRRQLSSAAEKHVPGPQQTFNATIDCKWDATMAQYQTALFALKRIAAGQEAFASYGRHYWRQQHRDSRLARLHSTKLK